LRKGQKDYITVFVDLDRRVPIGLVGSRKHKDIKDVLNIWGSGVLAQITEVSIDMSGNYRSLTEKMFPNATIVADRFHVIKMVGDELNSAIIKEKKTIDLIEDEAEKKEKRKS